MHNFNLLDLFTTPKINIVESADKIYHFIQFFFVVHEKQIIEKNRLILPKQIKQIKTGLELEKNINMKIRLNLLNHRKFRVNRIYEKSVRNVFATVPFFYCLLNVVICRATCHNYCQNK